MSAEHADTPGTALVISFSDLENDPRVRRHAEWLATDGWTVDTLGLGRHPAPEVREHFALGPQARWVRSRVGGILNYGVLPKRARFRNLMLERIPIEARRRIASGTYDLVVFEDYDFLPILTRREVFTPAAGRAHVHVDLHEYREPRLAINSIRRRLSDRYYRWRRSLIGHPAITTRTTVSGGIAKLYAADFGVPEPALVRNCPPFADLEPTDPAPDRIRLLYHGLASWARGFREILGALEELDDRFTMTFMLTPNRNVIEELRTAAAPLGSRVEFIPPVPMPDVPRGVNAFDLEIMLFEPTNANLKFALPNKLFEAVQGRLGLVIGRSPSMLEIVERWGNGVVVDGWRAEDLAATLRSLTPERVAELKRASDRAARELHADTERATFLSTLEGARRSGRL